MADPITGVGETIKGIADDAKLLVRDVSELAKSELTPTVKHVGIGAGLLAGAAYFGIVASILAFITIALGLYAAGLAPWLAFLIVTVALLLLAGIIGFVGFLQVRKAKAPEATIANAKDAIAELSGAVKRATAAAKAPQIEGTVVTDPRALR